VPSALKWSLRCDSADVRLRTSAGAASNGVGAVEAPPLKSAFVPVALPARPAPDIRIALYRDATAVGVTWPAGAASECEATHARHAWPSSPDLRHVPPEIAALIAQLRPQRLTRCGTTSRRIFSGVAATSAPSRNCWGKPMSGSAFRRLDDLALSAISCRCVPAPEADIG
jgi:hypothetical protein